MPTSSFYLFCFYSHLLLFTGPHPPIVTIMTISTIQSTKYFACTSLSYCISKCFSYNCEIFPGGVIFPNFEIFKQILCIAKNI